MLLARLVNVVSELLVGLQVAGILRSLSFHALLLDGLASQSGAGDQPLDFGGLLTLLAVFRGESAAHDVLLNDFHTVLLLEAEELAQFGQALGAEAARNLDVGQFVDVIFALLDDLDAKDADIITNDAAAD